MTDNLRIGMEAINRWIYHAWNYEMCPIAVPDYANNCSKRIYVPRFLAEVKWTCNLQHMVDKWKLACLSQNESAYLMTFYANLDNDNRRALLEWVLENYTTERKLF